MFFPKLINVAPHRALVECVVLALRYTILQGALITLQGGEVVSLQLTQG